MQHIYTQVIDIYDNFGSFNQSGEMLAMLNTICALPSLQDAAWHYSLLAAKNGWVPRA